ncbi:hypothetical protein Tco_1372379 [Tanacetum coccineum]
MSRAIPQQSIVSEEELVPIENRLKITNNNQRIASDSNIIDSFVKLTVSILKHHKLYKPISLTATVPEIYMQQFWTTLSHNPKTNTHHFKLDTQQFQKGPELLRTVLYMSPKSPNLLKKMNSSCLTGKDMIFDRARLPVLQIVWGHEDGERVICDQELVTWKLMSPSSQRMMLFQEEKEQSLLLTTSLKLKIVMLEKLVSIATVDPAVQSLLDLHRGFMLSRLESMRQEMLAGRLQGSNDAQDGEYV